MNCAKALAGVLLIQILLLPGEAAASSHSFQFPLDLTACTHRLTPCVFTQDYGHIGSNDSKKTKDKYHFGIDIGVLRGTEVRSVAEGVVARVQKAGDCKVTCTDHGYGNTVIIEHDRLGFFTQYSHLDEIKVKIDEEVKLNTVLGLSGCSGFDKTGNEDKKKDEDQRNLCAWPEHLHLEIKRFDTLRQEVVHGGTARSGAFGEITLDSQASSMDDLYNGRTIRIIKGAGVNQGRVISDYIGLTKVASVDRNWDTTPDNTSIFIIEEDWENCGWGYGSKHPDTCGYLDPVTFRQFDPNASTLIFPPIKVHVTPQGTQGEAVSIRWLPGDSKFIRFVTPALHDTRPGVQCSTARRM